ncbi:MAG: DNA polymerase I [Thermodesulfobacteriota bacterium]
MSIKEKLDLKQEPLFLIDGTSFLYRAFYAYPELKRSDGFPTNAIYILIRLLLRIFREESPQYGCFFLDGMGPTFRQKIFEPYKSQRLRMPESLSLQIPPVKQGVGLLGLECMETSDYEADDYICSVCDKFKDQAPIVIVGSDKDLKQCLDQNIVIWDPGQRNEKVITLDNFVEEEKLYPSQWPDFLALVGDKSDNIPGVPGIGPKTAREILGKLPSIKEIQDNLQELSPKQQEKLTPYLDKLDLYRELTQLRTDLEIKGSLEEFENSSIDRENLTSFFREYEFRSLAGEIPSFRDTQEEKDPQEDSGPAKLQKSPDAGIPDLTGEEIGLALNREEVYLGLGQEEYLGRYKQLELPGSLKGAKQIFTPDYKALLKIDSIYRDLPRDKFFDLSLASYLVNPEERNYNWDKILQAHLPEIDLHADNQGLAALRIGRLLREKLSSSNLLDLMYRVEMPLIPVLVAMEERGIKVDMDALQDFLQEVEDKIAKITSSIYTRAGMEFNLRSNPQMAEVLFTKLGLKPPRKTPGGAPSTANNVLESLKDKHPIIEDILQFRSLEKLRSTYLQPLPKLVDPKGRLHTTFNHLATATGRISSSKPNLQNIPIRGEFGPRMRSCFIAPQGKLLLAADYSQIELRILAHMSEDPELKEAFQLNEDIHTRTASLLFDKKQGDVGKDERRKAKTINFGLLYGMGPQKLSRELNIRMQEAKEFIGLYFSRLQDVSLFFQKVEQEAREKEYITTISGRRRFLQDINSRNENLAGQAKRMAINTRIQGSAADIIKMAMIETESDKKLRELGAELILQVHDELLFEVPRENADKAGERVSEIMSGVVSLNVPLTVEWGSGKDWSEAH